MTVCGQSADLHLRNVVEPADAVDARCVSRMCRTFRRAAAEAAAHRAHLRTSRGADAV
jgi:hypothetical protein